MARVIGHDEIERAVAIAQEAGGLILTYLAGDRMETREKGEKDVVTAADTASEALIKRRLQEQFPGDGVVAEEGTEEPGTTGRRWFIDPVDGTVNFAHRMPVWCVSMSLFEHDRPVLGVIYDPLREETFTAARGSGAFLNGSRVATSGVSDMGQAFVHHTIDFHQGTLQRGLQDIQILAPRVYRTRNIGSAALALAYVACGRFDAMVHRFAHTWDYGAGVLLVEEAGGAVTQFDGGPYSVETTDLVAAATGTLQAEIRTAVRDLSSSGLE
jgi:myo-inositol-1(or 4)-monophosphatase